MPGWLQVLLSNVVPIVLAIVLFIIPRSQSARSARRDTEIRELQLENWTREERRELEARLTTLEVETRHHQQQMDGLLKRLEHTVSTILHSPHTPALDRFIDESALRELDADEAREYVERLAMIARDVNESAGRRVAACVLMALIESRYPQARGNGDDRSSGQHHLAWG